MAEIITQIVMIFGAGLAGYGLRALQHPLPKRDKNGRFVKD